MTIAGGLDVHRQQITFDYLDTDTGEVSVGQIPSADRRQLAAWLTQRFADRGKGEHIEFSVEGCTGWRYVAEELAAAGMIAHLAEPVETANLRGRKKRAKTDRADARHQRDLLLAGRLPTCWIPPTEILEARALLGCYHDLRRDHTAWLQRIHAVLFHQGATACPRLQTAAGRAQLAAVTAEQLSPAGRTQVAAAVLMLEATEAQMDILHRQLLATARHMHGPRVLADRLYGVGPITGLALTCWLGGAGRFTSARKAVRFAGLDITVYSSAGKRSPGRLSRQGPAVLRWCLYEAGKTHSRPGAPDHAHYAAAKRRIDAKRAGVGREVDPHVRARPATVREHVGRTVPGPQTGPRGDPHPDRARRRRLRLRVTRCSDSHSCCGRTRQGPNHRCGSATGSSERGCQTVTQVLQGRATCHGRPE